MSVTLYRVGVPSIGEVYGRRYNYTRDSGGLGTGVYAFRTLTTARENAERGGSEVYTLHDALDNPVQPATLDATRAINDLSRRLALVDVEVERGEATWDELLADPGSIRVSVSSGFTQEPGLGSGKFLTKYAFDILLHTTELREVYGFDDEAFIRDALEATREAERGEGESQPINHLLYPDFDGIAPYPDAGGDSGRHGCVVFKEAIDACVGRETESFEEIPADTLNRCFQPP